MKISNKILKVEITSSGEFFEKGETVEVEKSKVN